MEYPKGFIPLTRSKTKEHIINNNCIFDIFINEGDMNQIDSLNTNTGYMDIWSYKRQQMY